MLRLSILSPIDQNANHWQSVNIHFAYSGLKCVDASDLLLGETGPEHSSPCERKSGRPVCMSRLSILWDRFGHLLAVINDYALRFPLLKR